uniref:Uncharacterized protein n=1 Tax=Rhizophora mucronata TaxID=61149 RepID=A0A2P2P566_RHIMU
MIPQRPPPASRFDLARSPVATSSPHPTHQVHHHNHAYQSHVYYPQPESHSAPAMLRPNAVRPSMNNPMIGIIEEMIYATVFGNSVTNAYAHSNSYHLAGTSSPRLRRHLLMADRSLGRISFFLFCCAFFCLLLF